MTRLGSDEFAVYLPTVGEASGQQVDLALSAAFEEPFPIKGYPLHTEGSIGAALYPTHGTDPLTLLRHAGVAMDSAKQRHERCVLYDAHHDRYHPRRLALLGDL